MPVKIRRILITLAYLFMISMLPNVDMFGHFGSLIGGALIGLTFLEGTSYAMTRKTAKMFRIVGAIGLVSYTTILIWICL